MTTKPPPQRPPLHLAFDYVSNRHELFGLPGLYVFVCSQQYPKTLQCLGATATYKTVFRIIGTFWAAGTLKILCARLVPLFWWLHSITSSTNVTGWCGTGSFALRSRLLGAIVQANDITGIVEGRAKISNQCQSDPTYCKHNQRQFHPPLRNKFIRMLQAHHGFKLDQGGGLNPPSPRNAYGYSSSPSSSLWT